MNTKSPLPYIIAGAAGAIVASVMPLLLTTSKAETKLLPFQGRLTDAVGTAIADGAKVVEFTMHDAPTGGNVKWAGEVHKLSVNGGLVNTMLGSKASLGGVDFSTPTYLQITVDAQADGAVGNGIINAADPPLLPRQSVIGSVYASVAGGIQYNTGPGTFASGGWEKVFTGPNPDTGKIDGKKLDGGSVGLPALSAEAISTLGNSGSLTQGSLVPSMTAQEAIGDRKAVAITKDAANNVRLLLANSSVGGRSGFYGFAKGAAAVNAPVTIHQFGALNGFAGLIAGSSYYVGTANGEITPIYPAGTPIYVGYSLATDTLFVDPFGVTRKWSNQNYWGNGSDGAFSTTGHVNLASTLDGDVVVKQYTSLIINAGHTMTVANRCRGLVIYVDGNCTINGTLTMTARGANVDPTLANSIPETGIRLARKKPGSTETLISGFDLGGTGLGGVGDPWRTTESLQPAINNNGKIYTISRAGGGSGGGRSGGVGPGTPGLQVANGSGGGGGGASGGYPSGTSGSGAIGTCYSGGTGGGGVWVGNQYFSTAGAGAANGGAGGNGAGDNGTWGGGGGAGNPGGSGANGAQSGQSGTGGLLVLFVRGTLAVGSFGRISAHGSAGGDSYTGGGGGSGGGIILVLHGGPIQNAEAIQALGGAGGAATVGDGNFGGRGGDGTVTIDSVAP